jgi:hypothetical protein
MSSLKLRNNLLAKKLVKSAAVSDGGNLDVITEPTHKPGGQQPRQTIKHLRRTMSGAAGSGQGTTAKRRRGQRPDAKIK